MGFVWLVEKKKTAGSHTPYLQFHRSEHHLLPRHPPQLSTIRIPSLRRRTRSLNLFNSHPASRLHQHLPRHPKIKTTLFILSHIHSSQQQTTSLYIYHPTKIRAKPLRQNISYLLTTTHRQIYHPQHSKRNRHPNIYPTDECV